MRNFFKILVLIALLGDFLFAYPTINESLEYLSSEELQGRKPGTDGIEKAKSYLESAFNELGLSKIKGTNSQEFEFLSEMNASSNSTLNFNVIIPKPGVPLDRIKPRTKSWALGEDWQIFSYTGEGKVEGELVFAGYGVSSPENNYDDYNGIDVNGKVVVVLTGAPAGNKVKFPSQASYYYKTKNAASKGAKAILFVKIQGDSSNVFESYDFHDIDMDPKIPCLQVNRTKIAEFFPKANQLYPVEKAINEKLTPNSFVLPNVTISINLELEIKKSKAYNVWASKQSKSKEKILVTAHYDHLGAGKNGIYYGADDNASGVSAIMELARVFNENPIDKEVVFIAFSCEEIGLLGSQHFVDNSPFPLDEIVAVVNLDMVGRLRKKELFINCKEGTALKQLVNSIENQELNIDFGSAEQDASDHVSFAKKGVPALHIYTGLHSEYHSTKDKANTINYQGLQTIVNYTESLIRTLDTKSAAELRK